MTTSSSRWRAAALLSSGALALHQLRYMLGYRGDSEHALADHGHAYIAVVAPLIALGLGLALSCFLTSLLRASLTGRREPSPPAFPHTVVGTTGTLLLIYGIQEWLEGLLAPGHPAGVAGILGHGGWTAVVLALAIGILIALLLRGANVAISFAASQARGARHPRPRDPGLRLPDVCLPARGILASKLAGRAPPLPLT